MLNALKRFIVGGPLATIQARHERLGKVTALAVFSSDTLSSVAYAPEESLLVLVLAGAGAIAISVPIALAIALLPAILISSYWQTIHARPSGGGSSIVPRTTSARVPAWWRARPS